MDQPTTTAPPATLWEALLQRFPTELQLAKKPSDHRTAKHIAVGAEHSQFTIVTPIKQKDYLDCVSSYFQPQGYEVIRVESSISLRKDGKPLWIIWVSSDVEDGMMQDTMILSVASF